jgi:hypothetical protein
MDVNGHTVLSGVPLGVIAAAAAVCGCGSTSGTSASLDAQVSVSSAAANPVTVSPLPGTQDASPAAQISFLGAPGTRVFDVRVLGSRSGVHTGVLRAYSTGTGESFLPARPFLGGERVSVKASVGTGAAIGQARTSFTVAHQAAVSRAGFPINAGDRRAVKHYASAPGLTPSKVSITTHPKPGASRGDLFVAPYQGAGSPGPMIVEQNGELVWFHPLPAGEAATNFQVQQFDGRPVLTWWQGRILQVGFGQGEDILYDRSYRPVARIRAGNGYSADLHELRLTNAGTAWIDVFDPIHMNLSSVHGAAAGVLTDSVVQEIDVKTGLVMWEWHALGHIPLRESNNPAPSGSYPWDYAHVNSIDPARSGHVLLSARNTWALYDVDIHSGGLVWRLGGRRSSFKLGPGARFYWQHDAELQPGGLISVFDNGSVPPKEKQSRGLLLDPDAVSDTVALRKQFVHPTTRLLAESQGNALVLPGGNWLLGYGRLPNFTEFDSSGHVLLDGTLGRDVQNFKTFLAPWSGQPTTRPSLAVQRTSAGAIRVKASWNGAANVAAWRVLAGAAPSSLAPIAAVPKGGFESAISLPTAGARRYVAVQAVDSSGAVIGVSPALKGSGVA